MPFGDPCWYQDWNVPYYNESHIRFRREMRAFVEEHIMPFCHEWDEARALPKDLFRKCAKAGILAGVIGPPWPKKYADYPVIGGIKHEEVSKFKKILNNNFNNLLKMMMISLMHSMNSFFLMKFQDVDQEEYYGDYMVD